MPVRFVLVRPRDPNNIGACARAMANFGFDDLFVVDPYELVWRQTRAAVQAEAVLENARAGSLEEALEGCGLVLGTSALQRRAPKQPVVALPGLGGFLSERLPTRGRLALLFGSEKTGLPNEALTLCHAVLRVPTFPAQPSMNLAQAVAVTAYELRRAPAPPPKGCPKPPAAQQLESLAGLLVAAAERAGYWGRSPRAEKERRARLLVRRLSLEGCDAAILQGLFKRLLA